MLAAVGFHAGLKRILLAIPACRYPYNLEFDYGLLEGLNKYSINNLGDPFIESNYGVHSREFEVHVLLRLTLCMCDVGHNVFSVQPRGIA